ncbi:DUF3857 domain-containing protein [Flavobacterium selenitireducens]|uniref:DUF3857 domain-containing protein n=1 Tax=Flavobacterium selenitireducens TaxID=2722704 RepID=UPI00168A8BA8|nr:DUF3857 domain-containing protein [Flavobacterium selenitireducens]MBD3583297.1 DUF3857 domain-containing protein [Flavobacterium selenitireducens]
MKKSITTILLFIAALASAQDKEEVRKMFWETKDQGDDVVAVPDRYKNESAVILYEYDYYYYPMFYPKQGVRKRIKLQDAAAVKEFSEFSLKEMSKRSRDVDKNSLGVRIIKPDGKVIEVDTEREFKQVDNDKILAIPGLEVGDIIDYYFYAIVTNINSIFDTQEATLADVYPTLSLRVELQLDKKLFINLNSYNGAPEFADLPPGRKGDRRLEIRGSDIPKIETGRWLYPMVALPCYKWQVSNKPFGKPDKEVANGKVKKNLTQEDMMFAYQDRYRPYGDMVHIERFLKKKTFENDADKVRQVYYFTRHYYYTQFIEAFAINEAKIFNPFELYKKPIFLDNETEFINHFMAFLKDNKIDYDIVVATARYNGKLDEILLSPNLEVMLRVNTTPEPVYLQYFSPFTNADQIASELENSDAYALNVFKRKKVTDVEQVRLPSSTYKDNTSKVFSKVSLDAAMTGLKVNRQSSLSGHLKEDEQKDRLYFFDYVNEDHQKFETEPVLDKVRSDKKQEQYKKEYDALISKYKEKQKENFKKSVAQEFDNLKIEKYEYSVKNTGRFGKNEAFVYDEEFDMENSFVKKAGSNYVVEIGKVISGQVEVNQKEKDRKLDVYMGFPRSFENEVAFDIPAGYSVQGLEKLNKNVTNATGGFVSSARVEGNQLVIKTNKYYTNYYEPNSNWPKMVDFLEAAYQFTQEKVLLKKA